MKDLKSNCFHYWQWFAFNHQEELYEIIMSMIKDRIEELLPQLVEQYIREYVNNITIDIQTKLNGKSFELSGIKDDIERMIIDSLK